MLIYRKKSVPAIYTQLPFIRKGSGPFADLPDDLDLIRRYQQAVSGDRCISEFDSWGTLYIAYDFPDQILDLDGSTGNAINYTCYYLKPWDAERYGTTRNEQWPAEAVRLEESELDQTTIRGLAEQSSCLELLSSLNLREHGYELSKESKRRIMNIESQLSA